MRHIDPEAWFPRSFWRPKASQWGGVKRQWGMGNERTRTLNIPFTLAFRISSCKSTHKGPFSIEERMQKKKLAM
jgi:hypothetical protein